LKIHFIHKIKWDNERNAIVIQKKCDLCALIDDERSNKLILQKKGNSVCCFYWIVPIIHMTQHNTTLCAHKAKFKTLFENYFYDIQLGMSISSVNRNLFVVWWFEVGEFFSMEMEMEVKVLPKEIWKWGRYFILRPAETPS
jgi:hypothetical protein